MFILKFSFAYLFSFDMNMVYMYKLSIMVRNHSAYITLMPSVSLNISRNGRRNLCETYPLGGLTFKLSLAEPQTKSQTGARAD